jgi:hypothetical protein
MSPLFKFWRVPGGGLDSRLYRLRTTLFHHKSARRARISEC